MLEKTCFISFLFLFTLVPSFVRAYSEEITLTLDKVVFLAKKNNTDLKALKFKYREMMREKLNLYRSFFPSISTSFSRADILSYGEMDSKNYEVTLSLEQVLYNQLSVPLSIKNHNLALKEASLKIELKEKEIERQVSNIYMDMLILDEIIQNRQNGLSLYGEYREMMHEEYKMGMKTLLDVIEVEKLELENEIELKKFIAKRDILYSDLTALIGVDINKTKINLQGDIDFVFCSILDVVRPSSFHNFSLAASAITERILSREDLKDVALFNNLEMKKMSFNLARNELKRKLLSIEFLKTISLGYEVDFTGEKFFPANRIHTFSVNFSFDLGGLISSETKFSNASRKSMKSSTYASSSSVIERLDTFNEKRKLELEIFTIQESIKEKERMITRAIKIWDINMKNLLEEFKIQVKKDDIFDKNKEILKLKLELGEIRNLEYLEFLIKKNDSLIENEKLKYKFINLIWDLEGVMNMDIDKILELS